MNKVTCVSEKKKYSNFIFLTKLAMWRSTRLSKKEAANTFPPPAAAAVGSPTLCRPLLRCERRWIREITEPTSLLYLTWNCRRGPLRHLASIMMAHYGHLPRIAVLQVKLHINELDQCATHTRCRGKLNGDQISQANEFWGKKIVLIYKVQFAT